MGRGEPDPARLIPTIAMAWVVTALMPTPASAQVSLPDDIILASRSGGGSESGTRAEPESTLGPSPGSRGGGGAFFHSPGSSQVLIGGRLRGETLAIPSGGTRTGMTSGLTSPRRGQYAPGREPFHSPERARLAEPLPVAIPSAGAAPEARGAEQPAIEDEGPSMSSCWRTAALTFSSGPSGFRMKSKAPRASPSTVTAALRSVRTLTSNTPTGGRSGREALNWRMSLSVSRPPCPGMFRSRVTRSGGVSRTKPTAF